MSNIHSAAHHHHRTSAAPSPAEISGDRGSLLQGAHASLALHLAVRSRRPEAARGLLDGHPAGREDHHADRAVHLQMGGRCADRPWQRAGRARQLARLGDRLADPAHTDLRRRARLDGRAAAMARRCVRQGRDARGAQACVSHLRAHARAVAALPPRAQDRWSDAHARARPRRHRDHGAHGDPAAGSDHRRGRAGRRRAALLFRLALRAGNGVRRRGLHVLHLHRDRVADRHPPPHERVRHRGQHQGDRTRCSTTRR